MSDSNNPPDAENASEGSSRSSTRVAVTAIGFLLCFALAVYVMRALTPGATLIVEADPATAALLETRRVKIHQTDGPLVQILEPGRQRMRAGKYRLEANIDGVRVEFSTGKQFKIAKGEVLRMEVTSQPVE